VEYEQLLEENSTVNILMCLGDQSASSPEDKGFKLEGMDDKSKLSISKGNIVDQLRQRVRAEAAKSRELAGPIPGMLTGPIELSRIGRDSGRSDRIGSLSAGMRLSEGSTGSQGTGSGSTDGSTDGKDSTDATSLETNSNDGKDSNDSNNDSNSADNSVQDEGEWTTNKKKKHKHSAEAMEAMELLENMGTGMGGMGLKEEEFETGGVCGVSEVEK
jgi:hypothetical protein